MSMSNKLAKREIFDQFAPANGILTRRANPYGGAGGAWAPGSMRYMGDPGLFGDIWGGIKSIGRVATGIVGGLGIPVVSGVARTAGGLLFGRAPGTSTVPSLPPAPMPPQVWALPGVPALSLQAVQECPPGTHKVMGQCVNLPFGGAPGAGIAPPPTASMGGYHLNKSGYFLMDGSYVAPGSKWVKNRRRNPGNMRALSRSMGRIKSAKRMAGVLGQITFKSSCPPRRSRSRSKH